MRLMNILMEEEKKLFSKSSDKALKLKTEADFSRRENLLQTSVDRFYMTIKERKHKQLLRDLRDFKEKRAFDYLHSENKTGVQVSSSDIESSDSESQ